MSKGLMYGVFISLAYGERGERVATCTDVQYAHLTAEGVSKSLTNITISIYKEDEGEREELIGAYRNGRKAV